MLYRHRWWLWWLFGNNWILNSARALHFLNCSVIIVCSSNRSLHWLSEGDGNVKVVNNIVTISTSLAEVFTIAELEAEIVRGGNRVTYPLIGALQELDTEGPGSGSIDEAHKVHNTLDRWSQQGNCQQRQVRDFSHHSSVAVHIAGKFSSVCSHCKLFCQ